ncbi:MAG: hypothetical protein IJW31_09175 [Lentisphaeria bacterium]|nr:hypothetical protein [Lentisphaeria bacterium]MBR7128250.1 hypothetical protein [Lentisphaeria bacterium]
MSQQLQGLLDKINQDGIAKAQEQSRTIIADANRKANEIIEQAKQEAAQMVKNASIEADNLTKRAESAISQASRDIILKLKSEIENRLNKVLSSKTEEVMTADFMAGIIKDLVAAFIQDKDTDITVLTAVKDVEALNNAVQAALRDSFKGKAEVFADREISGGFKVNISGDDLYYDFSNEAIVELLASYVTPRVAELLK